MRKANSKNKSGNKGGNKPAEPIANPVLTLDVAVVGGKLLNVASENAAKIAHPVEGLAVLDNGKGMQTFPTLAKFPLGYTRTGNLNGKLMNISQYCRMKTGCAWNDKHAAAVFEKENIKLRILNPKNKDDKKRRDELSADLDAMRPAFYQEVKGITAAFMSRKDVEVQQARLTSTSKGITLTSRAVLPLNAVTEADQLRAELQAAREQNAALTAALPKKVAKALLKQSKEKAIDVAATRSPLNEVPAAPEGSSLVESQNAEPLVTS